MAQGLETATGFTRRNGELHVDGVPLSRIAEVAGTPSYVYSASVLRERAQRLTQALAGIPHRVHFAAKANGSAAVLRTLREQGIGVDVVSGGELFQALRAGFKPEDIVFDGVGKTPRDMSEALDAGVKLINLESEDEARRLSALAVKRGRNATVGLRVNPDVEVENAHHYIATGDKEHKFGVPLDDAARVARVIMGLPGLTLSGFHMHVGSQLFSYGAYDTGSRKLVQLAHTLRGEGAPIKYLDLGGGLPVPYRPEEPEPDLAAYAELMKRAVDALGDVELILEHGRYLVAASAVLLTEVLYRKHNGGVEFVVCDAGMTELIRVSHYDAYHHIEPVAQHGGEIVADVVGPVCESGDFLGVDRTLPDVPAGALMVVHTVGAYGAAMASRYNGRPFAAEVMVDGTRFAVVTEREAYDALVRQDVVSPQWQEA
ncbi:MAG: diaminopimelate decarboxylase [Gemmatimonadaceae bacterium]|nr:diaminopimelate decarboxylase [Gemmatimonadaceae bacterium]